MEKVRGTLLKPMAETTSLYLGVGGSLHKEVELPNSRSWRGWGGRVRVRGDTEFIHFRGVPKPRKVSNTSAITEPEIVPGLSSHKCLLEPAGEK